MSTLKHCSIYETILFIQEANDKARNELQGQRNRLTALNSEISAAAIAASAQMKKIEEFAEASQNELLQDLLKERILSVGRG